MVNWEKNWSCKNNDTLNLWRSNAILIVFQETLGPPSDQKVVVNFIWLTTSMPSWD